MRFAWLHGKVASVIIGLVVGAAVGAAVYQGSQLAGRNLYILCGTTAGAVAAVVINGYARSVSLTEITVSVPQLGEMKFAVTNDNKQIAWRLFVEAVTRVSVQPLADDAGFIREAMNSLYQLFGHTRDVLAAAVPSRRTADRPTVEHLAIAMLNNELRPFLSSWHPRLRIWELANPGAQERDWPDAARCRADLAIAQANLVRYAVNFGELAGVDKVQDVIWGRLSPEVATANALVPSQAGTADR